MKFARLPKLVLIVSMVAVPVLVLWLLISSLAERHAIVTADRERFLLLASRRIDGADMDWQADAMHDLNRGAGILGNLPPQQAAIRLDQLLDAIAQAQGGVHSGSEIVTGREERDGSVIVLKTMLHVPARKVADLLKRLEQGDPALFVEDLRLSHMGMTASVQDAEVQVAATLWIHAELPAMVDKP
jgi:hypothetical protein